MLGLEGAAVRIGSVTQSSQFGIESKPGAQSSASSHAALHAFGDIYLQFVSVCVCGPLLLVSG